MLPSADIVMLVPASIAPLFCDISPFDETVTAPDENTSVLKFTFPFSAAFVTLIVPASAVTSCNDTSPEVVLEMVMLPVLSASSNKVIAVFSACVMPFAAVIERFPLISSMSPLIFRALSAVTVNAPVPTISPRFISEFTPFK